MPYPPPHTVRKLLNRYQKILRLNDWAIDYQPEYEPGEDEAACIRISRNSKVAELAVSEPVNLKKTMAHELLHLHMASVEWLFADVLENYVQDPRVGTLISSQFDEKMERAVDTIALAIAELDNA